MNVKGVNYIFVRMYIFTKNIILKIWSYIAMVTYLSWYRELPMPGFPKLWCPRSCVIRFICRTCLKWRILDPSPKLTESKSLGVGTILYELSTSSLNDVNAHWLLIIPILEVLFHLWQWDTIYFHNTEAW